MSTPQTMICMCSNTGLNSRYEHTLYFNSPSAQSSYFNGKKVKTYTKYAYTRRSWSLKVEASMSDACKWDYMFFRNFTDGKVYYYFINNVEYENEGAVTLTFELDVMQTYLFDWKLHPCFIERQHTKTDGIGENTVEESIDTGELTIASSKDITELNDLGLLFMSTIYPPSAITGEEVNVYGSNINGIFSGVGIYAVDYTEVAIMDSFLRRLDKNGLTDSIIGMWCYPKALVKLKDTDWTENRSFVEVKNSTPLSKSYTRPDTFKGYTPKNNKLYTYPYNFLYVSNNSGAAATYRYERFINKSVASFELSGVYSPDGVVRMTPLGYDGVAEDELNYDKGLSLGGFPVCAWNSDTYKIWLAQSQASQAQTMGMGALSFVGGIAGMVVSGFTGNPGGVLASGGVAFSGYNQISGVLNARKDREVMPNEMRGAHSPSVNVVNKKQTFTVMNKQVTPEYARIIDDYFTMYGYAIRKVDKPDIAARPRFTYIKTIGCHVTGGFCVEDVNKIESIFNNGITFWKDTNPDTIFDYSIDNK